MCRNWKECHGYDWRLICDVCHNQRRSGGSTRDSWSSAPVSALPWAGLQQRTCPAARQLVTTTTPNSTPTSESSTCPMSRQNCPTTFYFTWRIGALKADRPRNRCWWTMEHLWQSSLMLKVDRAKHYFTDKTPHRLKSVFLSENHYRSRGESRQTARHCIIIHHITKVITVLNMYVADKLMFVRFGTIVLAFH